MLIGGLLASRNSHGITCACRGGAWADVAVSGKATCPVNMINRYLDKAQLSHNSPFFVSYPRQNMAIKPRARGLGYPRLRELVIQAFRGIVVL